MTSCFSFVSCFSGFSESRRNNVFNSDCKRPSATKLDARYKRLTMRRQKAETSVLAIPGPGHNLHSRVLKSLPPSNQPDVPNFEEIDLNTPTTVKRTADRNNNDRNWASRLRKLILREKTPEELEMEKLRQERKAIKKFLKGKNLYSRDMTNEQMKDLKYFIEFFVERRTDDNRQKHIKMKTNESTAVHASVKTRKDSEPKPVKAFDISKKNNTANESNKSCVKSPESEKPTQLVTLVAPEIPLAEIDGANFIGPVNSVKVVPFMPDNIPCDPEPETSVHLDPIQDVQDEIVLNEKEDHVLSVMSIDQNKTVPDLSQIFSPPDGHFSATGVYVAWADVDFLPQPAEMESSDIQQTPPSAQIKNISGKTIHYNVRLLSSPELRKIAQCQSRDTKPWKTLTPPEFYANIH